MTIKGKMIRLIIEIERIECAVEDVMVTNGTMKALGWSNMELQALALFRNFIVMR